VFAIFDSPLYYEISADDHPPDPMNSMSFIWNNYMREKREANVNECQRHFVLTPAYKGNETDVLYGVEMAWRADATPHTLLTQGFTF
jgi:hypothetical protein